MLLDLVTVAVLAFVGSRLVGALRHAARPPVRQRVLTIVQGLRPRHFLLAVPVLAAVITAASLLLEVPGLDFGWWIFIGGEGNPVTGGTARTEGTVLDWLIPAVFLVLLLPVLPLFAEREEEMFRLDAEHWSTARRLRRGIEFGLVHAVIGIPVGVALALSLGGWYFTWAYLRGWRRCGPPCGLLESTQTHLAYNLVVLSVVVAALAMGV